MSKTTLAGRCFHALLKCWSLNSVAISIEHPHTDRARSTGVPSASRYAADPSREEFQQLPLRVHAFLADVPLHDVWVIDLPRPHNGITLAEFLRRAGNLFGHPPPEVRALLSVRFFVGALFGWDHATSNSLFASFAHRLTDEDRTRSLAPPRTPDGLFRIVYRFENEQLDEIVNRTMHAGALVETVTGYRFYLAVYVREVSPFTRFYMAAIDPFRKLIVYPALLRSAASQWIVTFRPNKRTSS